MQPAENYDISCSIVLYNHQPKQVTELINSILAYENIKLFLVDNSAADILKQLTTDSRIEYIFNNANIGYGAAHNIAIKRAMPIAKYHIVLNPDISFEDGVLNDLYNFMQKHPEIGHLMPKIKYPSGTLQYTCKLLPYPTDLIIRRFLPAALTKKRMIHFEMHNSGYNKLMEVPYLSGCFMFLRIEALKKVGLFDERFFLYPEDIDLTRRIHKHYKTVFYPEVEVIHGYERASYKSLKLLLVHIVNMVRYFNKWGWIFDVERRAVNKKILTQFKK